MIGPKVKENKAKRINSALPLRLPRTLPADKRVSPH
jgi:hypothetical protein